MTKKERADLGREIARLRTKQRIAEAGWSWSEADMLEIEIQDLLSRVTDEQLRS